jgi:hypothetical protein
MNMPPTGAKAKRKARKKHHDDKKKIVALLQFDTENSYDKWRRSAIVKPWWDLFVSRFLDQNSIQKKAIHLPEILTWILDGERGGKRRFHDAMRSPKNDDANNWHAWLTFWLAKVNVTDRRGHFLGRNLDKIEIYRRASYFVVWAKRQRQREIIAARNAKSRKIDKKQSAGSAESHLYEESEVEAEMDVSKGTAIVKWTEGMPEELEMEGASGRITIENFCGYDPLDFQREVDTVQPSHSLAVSRSSRAQDRNYIPRSEASSARYQQARALLPSHHTRRSPSRGRPHISGLHGVDAYDVIQLLSQ